jgi:hypothetical protein
MKRPARPATFVTGYGDYERRYEVTEIGAVEVLI